MKKIYCTSLFLLIAINISIIGQVDQRKLYERKIKTYKNMQTGGIVMGTIGVAAGGVGVYCLVNFLDYANSDNYDDDYENEDEYMNYFMIGLIASTVGITMTTAGIVVGAIGGHKVKQYKRQMNSLSMGIICTPQKQGLSLTYRF